MQLSKYDEGAGDRKQGINKCWPYIKYIIIFAKFIIKSETSNNNSVSLSLLAALLVLA